MRKLNRSEEVTNSNSVLYFEAFSFHSVATFLIFQSSMRSRLMPDRKRTLHLKFQAVLWFLMRSKKIAAKYSSCYFYWYGRSHLRQVDHLNQVWKQALDLFFLFLWVCISVWISHTLMSPSHFILLYITVPFTPEHKELVLSATLSVFLIKMKQRSQWKFC